ncbi:MAG: helix-turn-helix transcriptional regulator [Pseudomonadales bacterium]|nr:helix-turn-helix transcriptional regulator [Pseudomonadales bacterium]
MLKQHREKARLTRKELADIAEVTPQAISNYESGSRTPSLKVAIRIIEALRKRKVKVPISDLVPPSN